MLSTLFMETSFKSQNPVRVKVIKTIIYGARPSGNQAIKALKETAGKMENKFPTAASVARDDLYVDDIISGCEDTISTVSVTE